MHAYKNQVESKRPRMYWPIYHLKATGYCPASDLFLKTLLKVKCMHSNGDQKIKSVIRISTGSKLKNIGCCLKRHNHYTD